MKTVIVFTLLLVYTALASTCPDKTTCAGSATCCQMQDSKYGCCPYANAECCSDKQHCCPSQYECDTSKGECVHKFGLNAVKFGLINDQPVNEKCGDGSSCPAGNTCCQLSSGGYGCCPYPKATCCEDKQHCCPNGYKCDMEHSQCVKQAETISIVKIAGKKHSLNEKCQDGSECATGTCCELSSGGYGCCPYKSATCCEDKQHCCPNGYKCDMEHSKCVKGNNIQSLIDIKSNEVCGDGSECPDGNTCCELESGGYGCCPYSDATCCEDKAHCCPNGYNCDLVHMQCVPSVNKVISMKLLKH